MLKRLHLQRSTTYLLTCALVLGLTACVACTMPAGSDPAATSAPDSRAAPGRASHASAPPPGLGDAAGATDAMIPADVVVSTNEPFWTARVEGGHLFLQGLDDPERKLPISSSQIQGQTRRIVARDRQGEVELRVHAGKCEDSMSGAEFPFSGELRLPGADETITGCARPASMPPPTPPGAAP